MGDFTRAVDDTTNSIRVSNVGANLDTTNNATRTEGIFTELTGSASSASTLIPITEVGGIYRSYSVQISGTYVATIAIQAANDVAFANPINIHEFKQDGATNADSTSFTSTGLYAGAVNARYVRVQVTSYTSGTVTAVMELFSVPYSNTVYGASQVGVWFETPQPNATATGLTPFFNSAVVGTVLAVKASSGRIGYYNIYNPNASAAYLQVFNVAQGSVTLGTTPPTHVIAIPASSVVDNSSIFSMSYGTAISIAATTTPTGNTAVSTGLVTSIGYI